MPLLINMADLDDYQEVLDLKLSRFDIVLIVRCCSLIRQRKTTTSEQNALIADLITRLEGHVDRVDQDFAAKHPTTRFVPRGHHANR